MRVLQGEFREGDAVTVDAAGGELEFRKVATGGAGLIRGAHHRIRIDGR